MKREKPKYKDLSRQEDIYNFFRVGEEHFNVLYGPIIKDIKNFCQKRGMLILDLGCGPGTLAIHLARDNHDNRIIGVDLSKGMISFAKSQKNKAMPVNNASFLVANAEYLPFSNNGFDLIYSNLSLHHWEAPISVFNQLHEIAKRNGLIIIRDIKRCNNYLQYIFIWVFALFFKRFARRSIRRAIKAGYNKKELVSMLKEGRLKPIKISEDLLFINIVCSKSENQGYVGGKIEREKHINRLWLEKNGNLST